ncbi:MAG: FAD-dependent oxidoreductase [Lentisphaerae bacterium]|nr:FAD-dependent oxidoreductase [Lentisphaerota bacterium]
MREILHEVDFCVVGGGLAGMCAAVSAARRGIKTALIQDRPVLGGNASSEIRMHVCGAHGRNNRETGIIEEIVLKNAYRNPTGNYFIWDSVFYETVRFEPNITLLLNTSCLSLEKNGNRIVSVKGWQLTTQTWHTVKATLFSDCSGDSILAPLSGAEFRMGREARSEFDEDIQPEIADTKTMGMSCILQARKTDKPSKFIPPSWAYSYPTEEKFEHRGHDISHRITNYWWIEVGGEGHSIHNTEESRDELLKIAFGVWDHIKNYGDHDAENWELEWVGFLPGKRESRRYIGDLILTQNHVRAEGRFEDLIAYGGWSMDDHHPAGFYCDCEQTIFHPAPSPYGIPYRSLYSRNIDNLFFAGRNISVTHAALSSTRVMATCATLGQAVGTAAAIAIRENTGPRGVYENHIHTLKQELMDDDAYLPFNSRTVPTLSKNAKFTSSEGDPEVLRNGIDRPIGETENLWTSSPGEWIEYSFEEPVHINRARIIFDSSLNRFSRMPCSYPIQVPLCAPETLTRSFKLEAKKEDGSWENIYQCDNNHQRLVKVKLDIKTTAIRLVPLETWGAEKAGLFAFDVR